MSVLNENQFSGWDSNEDWGSPKPVKLTGARKRMRAEGRLAQHAQDSVAENETLGYKTETRGYYQDNQRVHVGAFENDWKRYSASQE